MEPMKAMNGSALPAKGTTISINELVVQKTSAKFAKLEESPSIVSIVPPSHVSVGTESSSSSIASYAEQSSSDVQGSSNVYLVLGASVGAPTASVGITPSESSDQKCRISSGSSPSDSRPVQNIPYEGILKTGSRVRTSDDILGAPLAKKARIEEAKDFVVEFPVLLALPTDPTVLPPLHVLVRKQVEVFEATEADIAQPAPGRKTRIRLNQVGLRCIHCKCLPFKDRVKRAVCFPSSVGRVYNSVSDMKFDHFSICKGLPLQLRQEFSILKQENKVKRYKKSKASGCSSSTAQYYHDTSVELGMINGEGGIYMAHGISKVVQTSQADVCRVIPATALQSFVPTLPGGLSYSLIFPAAEDKRNVKPESPPLENSKAPSVSPVSQKSVAPLSTPEEFFLPSLFGTPAPTGALPTQQRMLSSPMDRKYLNELHCFVRQNIEVFAATSQDVTAPSPGRKLRVILGQVGLRCVHCKNLRPKDRVKRAVCYPASVSGVYHSVSNMKFDHFGKCRGLPEAERQRFNVLRKTCGRHGPRTAKGSGKASSDSTAKYYNDAALHMGLIDSESGIRFKRDDGMAASEEERCRGLTCTDGISALMIAASVRSSGV